MDFPDGSRVKNQPAMQETQDMGIRSLHWKIPWRKWQPTPVSLPGKSHGQRSLAGYSPWGCKELDMTERLNTFREYISDDLKQSSPIRELKVILDAFS